ncbi:hypothetical protein C0989_011218 [Termitomyces sp. Mn162]|nr:hypothetical protein C0989_011218 [Termitomyces sp. Mn162]
MGTEVANALLTAAEEPFSSSTQTGTAPNEAGPSSLVAATSPSPSAAPVAASQAMTTEKAMELDSDKEASAFTTGSSEVTDPITPGSVTSEKPELAAQLR